MGPQTLTARRRRVSGTAPIARSRVDNFLIKVIYYSQPCEMHALVRAASSHGKSEVVFERYSDESQADCPSGAGVFFDRRAGIGATVRSICSCRYDSPRATRQARVASRWTRSEERRR